MESVQLDASAGHAEALGGARLPAQLGDIEREVLSRHAGAVG